MAFVLDTGPVVAYLDRNDPAYDRCAEFFKAADDLIVPSPILGEVDYWLRKRRVPHVWDAFVSDLVDGAYRLEHTSVQDVRRAAELKRDYADLRLGFVDAAVIAICERLRETKVVTLDHRHFSVVRPRHCSALELLPA